MRKLIDDSSVGFRAANRFDRLVMRGVKSILALDSLNQLHCKIEDSSRPFPRRMVDALGVKLYSKGSDLTHLLSGDKPTIVVANIASGVVDILLALSEIEAAGRRVKVLLPEITSVIAELRPYIIPISESKMAVSANIRAAKEALDFVAVGGVLVLLATQQIVSYSDIERYKWRDSALKFIKLAGADVIQIFTEASNSLKYKALRRISSKASQLLLFREMLRQRNSEIKQLTLQPIPSSIISSIGSIKDLSLLLQAKLTIAQASDSEREMQFISSVNRFNRIDVNFHGVNKLEPIVSNASYRVVALRISDIESKLLCLSSEDSEVVGEVLLRDCAKLICEDEFYRANIFKYFEFGREFNGILSQSLEAEESAVVYMDSRVDGVREILADAQYEYLARSSARYLIKCVDVKPSHSRVAISMVLSMLRRQYVAADYKSLITPRNAIKRGLKPVLSDRYRELLQRRDIFSLLLREADSEAVLVLPQIKKYLQNGAKLVRLCRSFDAEAEKFRALILIDKEHTLSGVPRGTVKI